MKKLDNFKPLIKNTLYVGIITFIICILCYLYLDRLFILNINNHINQVLVFTKLSKFISTLFAPNNWASLFFVLFLICIWQYVRRKLNQRLMIWTLTLFIAIVTTLVVKILVARYRPELFLQDGLYGFHGFSHKRLFNSFPSGHTSLAFAGFLGLSYFLQNKKLTFIFIILAILISISRIVSGQHYLSDVIGAAYIGLFSFLWAKQIIFFAVGIHNYDGLVR
ncbi:phosphatase PAP2 family protein [Fastidiosibacter lacustris]|uniref:phosphatase PAP2 family protein n=1 Tax=Fastidiosibacter lacustris TaxID=2056695 RepID=UPI000E343981|nr:phosphatase PAP2 family protein [Fastidiosibacter lacustris]